VMAVRDSGSASRLGGAFASPSASAHPLRTSWRLDHAAVCACVFPRGDVDGLVIVTADGLVLVYVDDALAWAARAPSRDVVSVAVARTIGSVPGMLVFQSMTGQVTVGYLGTTPPPVAVGGGLAPAEARELPYAAMDAEHKRLLAEIKQS
jgi:hypothetical protein